MRQEFSPHVQQALSLARTEAERLGNNYIGAEHLFLGLLDISDCGAVRVLQTLGVKIDRLRKEVESWTGPGKLRSQRDDFPITPRTRMILKLAGAETKALSTSKRIVGTEHVLLGFVQEADSLPARVLQEYGITVEPVRQIIVTS